MPGFTFKGFSTGSSVAIVAMQGVSSEAGAVPAWGQGASAANALPDQDWIVDDDNVDLDVKGDFTANGNTLTFAITGLPSGLIDDGDGTISGRADTDGQSGTIIVTATDQFGLETTSAFNYTTAYRTQATASGGLGPFAFEQDSAIAAQDLAADFTANGNTLSYAITGTALPSALTVSSAGSMAGTPTNVTASASYTVRGTDEYGRTTDSSFSLAITVAVPTLTSPTGTQTGQTTATWSVTSDEAGGTIFAAARLSTDGVPSKTSIENGTGNTVATSSDTTPAADANNGGNFTGLSAGTSYVVDVFQRDAAGNESAVSSSAAFSTQAAGTASLNISTVQPIRLVAPAGIWLTADGHAGFDVGAPGAGEVYDPRYHEITHIWDTDDSGTWSAPSNMPSEWNDKARAYGPRVCHTYESPGTYTPSVWAIDSTGTSGVQNTPLITVLDADDVYTGASTIVIALDGIFTGKPTGATQVTSISALQAAINALSSGTPARILFKRGENYDDVSLDLRKRQIEYIGAWGTDPARPICNGKQYVLAADNWMFNYQGNSVITQITICDLDLRNNWEAAGEVGSLESAPWWVLTTTSDNAHMTVHNVRINGFAATYCDPGAQTNRPGSFIMSDCTVTNWRNYGCFLHRNENQPNSRAGWVGCRIAQDPDALHGESYQGGNILTGNDHGPIRYEAMGQVYIGACDLFSSTGWSGLAPDQAIQPCLRMNTYSDSAGGYAANVERCVMEGGFHTINMAGENPLRVEKPGNYLFDKLVMIASSKTASAGGSGNFFHASFGGTTIRNVLGMMPNVGHYHDVGNNSRHCINFSQDNPGSGNAGAPVAVYNCTFVNLRDTANDPGFSWTATLNDASFNNLTVENNVVHAPDIDTPVNGDAPLASGALSGITPRYKGSLVRPDDIEGTLGATVAIDAFFTVSYPAGTAQAFWQAIESIDTKGLLTMSGVWVFAQELGYWEPDYQAAEIRIYNRSAVAWDSGTAYKLRLDRKSTYTISGSNPDANPSTIPLPRPGNGSAAISDGDTGRKAYDDLLGSVRPASGNERGALLSQP